MINKKKVSLIFVIGLIVVSCSLSFIYRDLKKQGQPNVLLITIDALRPDHLGCYGYKRNTSPHIDKLASEGTKFNQAIAQSCWTHPSILSFFTSTFPYKHLVSFGSTYNSYLNISVPNISDILNSKGYTTALITDHAIWFGLDRMHGFKDNFDFYIEADRRTPKVLLNKAVKWLEANKDRKFFLWFYYLGAHAPYEPSLPYSKKFYSDNLANEKHIPIANSDKVKKFGVIPKHVSENNITDVSYYISKYDGKIRVSDKIVGLLLSKLEELNLNNNTLIILMTDHGESLGEHDLYFYHGFTLYDITLKVPLIIRYPKLIPKNKTIDSQVRLLDVVPTIIDILNLKDKKYENMDGKSLLPMILGEERFPEYAFSDNGWIFSIRSENWKLIYIDRDKIKDIPWSKYYTSYYQLYNLRNDPKETKNLVKEEKTIFLNLRQKLNEYIKKARLYQKKLRLKMSEKPNKLDEKAKQRLKSLGYIE